MTVVSLTRSSSNNNYCQSRNDKKSHQSSLTMRLPLSLSIAAGLRLSIICNVVLFCFVGILLFQQHEQLSSYTTGMYHSFTAIKSTGMLMMRELNNRTYIGEISNALPDGMVHRDYIFHGGHPVTSELRGSCYCSGIDMYCMCNPSLAIDIVIVSGPDHLWFVRRKDTNSLAIVGGFVDIGETIIDAVYRELYEETGLMINNTGSITASPSYHSTEPVLFGVYSDPRRDNRRHTVSVAFAVHLDGTEQPIASDDVKNVERIHITKLSELTLFADQKTVVQDYVRMYFDTKKKTSADFLTSYDDFAPNIHRSMCVPFNVA